MKYLKKYPVLGLLVVCLSFAAPSAFAREDRDDPRVRICSWNIYNLSVDKASRAGVINDLASIMYRNSCDVLSIQELKTDTATNNPVSLLLERLKQISQTTPGDTTKWEALYSDLTGGAPDPGQAEAYGLIWRKDKLIYLDSGLYDASALSRKPHVSGFRSTVPSNKAFDFILYAVHTLTDPHLTAEFAAIKTDLDTLTATVSDEPDIIILGDLNKKPSTVANTPWQNTFGGMRWAFTNPPDSSMAAANKLNDNIVWGSPTFNDYAERKRIHNFTVGAGSFANSPPTDKRLSDHLPVWAEFWANRDEQ